jgi:hypothetical protein
MELVREAGFTLACSNRYGRHNAGEDRWQVRRIWIDSTDTMQSFIHKVTGRLDAMRLIDAPGAIQLRRWLNKKKRPDR